ncbi:unnamed protein product [Closterium sp. Yama58-4]|nr:unnamed protein product [Closterium sp. Yama58-4]
MTSAASSSVIQQWHVLIQRRELPKGSTPYILLAVCLLLVLIFWLDIFSIFQDEEQALIRASSSIPPQFAQSTLTQSDSPPSSPGAAAAAGAAGESAQQHTDTTPASSPANATANTAPDGSEPSAEPSAEPAAPDSSSNGAGHSGLSNEPEGGDIAHMFRPAEWRQHTFRRVGLVSFAQFSGYRISPTEFAAVGLAARALDEGRKVGKCVVEVLHVGEHHWWKYAGLILLCTLKREAYVADGGWLHMRIDGEDVVVYEEQAGEVVNAVPHPPFLHNITHCSPPIHHQVRADRVHQWMDLHIRMGVDHYVLYDVGGVDLQLRSVLQPFLEGGIVEVTDFRDVVNYESWYYGQVMIVNDCVYRFRRLSKWLMYLDFDEFIFIDGQERVPNPMSVHDLLTPHEGLPYVSHGCLWWDHERCLPAQGENDPRWPLERMLWHWPFIYCQAKDNTTDPKLCLDHWGHRKLFVDPRKVRVVENHVVTDPIGGGKDLPTDALRHHHFRGIVKYGASECSLGMKADDPIEWWAHGTEEADRMHYVRTHPLDMPLLVAAHKWWKDYVLRTQRGQ